MNERIITLQIY